MHRTWVYRFSVDFCRSGSFLCYCISIVLRHHYSYHTIVSCFRCCALYFFMWRVIFQTFNLMTFINCKGAPLGLSFWQYPLADVGSFFPLRLPSPAWHAIWTMPSKVQNRYMHGIWCHMSKWICHWLVSKDRFGPPRWLGPKSGLSSPSLCLQVAWMMSVFQGKCLQRSITNQWDGYNL